MFDREACDARRDAIARLARTGGRIDITNRYLGVASYGGVRRLPRPVEPAPRPPAPAPPPAPYLAETAAETAADADRLLGRVGDDAAPTRPARRAGRRWSWRRILLAAPSPDPARDLDLGDLEYGVEEGSAG